MLTARRTKALGAIVLAACATVASAQPVPMYEVRDLGTLAGPGGMSGAFGLNEHGEVVGVSSAPTSSATSAGLRPFIWGAVPGSPLPVMRDLLPGVAGTGLAQDINEGRVAVGTMRRTNTGATQGFVVGGIAAVIPPVQWIQPLQGGTTTAANAINDTNIVVGSSNIAFGPALPSATHAIRWHNGQTQGLGTLGGRNSEALGINTAGTIVGWSDTAPTSANTPVRRGFVLPVGSNQMLALSALSPNGNSRANDISDFNMIVGSADVLAAVSPLHPARATRAVMWTPNSVSIINLGVLRNTDRSSEALGVNSQGDVVGWSGSPTTTIAPSTGAAPLPGGQGTRAFLWRDGHMTDLNTRIPPNSGWILHAATEVNDDGHIVGWGTRILNTTPTAAPRIHAFILTPMPLDSSDVTR